MTRDVGPAKSEMNPVDHWREVERAARDELRRRADAAFEEIVAILRQHANSLDVAQKARIRSLLKRGGSPALFPRPIVRFLNGKHPGLRGTIHECAAQQAEAAELARKKALEALQKNALQRAGAEALEAQLARLQDLPSALKAALQEHNMKTSKPARPRRRAAGTGAGTKAGTICASATEKPSWRRGSADTSIMRTHDITANIPDELYRRLGETIQMEPGASMSGVIEQALEGYLAQRAWRHQQTLTALEQAAGGCLIDDQEMDRWMTANFGPDPGKAEPGA